MKRFIAFISGLLLFLLIGCGGTDTTNPPGETTQEQTTPGQTPAEGYRDGSYTGEGDPWEHGNENATVEIADGKIESIVLRRLDTEGQEVDYELFSGVEKDGRFYPDLKKYREDMAKEMVEKQSADVDAIAGATISTKNWRLAVERALEKASE